MGIPRRGGDAGLGDRDGRAERARAGDRPRHRAAGGSPRLPCRWADARGGDDGAEPVFGASGVPVGRAPHVRRGIRCRGDPRDRRRVEYRVENRAAWTRPATGSLAGPSNSPLRWLGSPSRSPSRFLFGYLEGLAEGSYRVRNDRLGLAARLSWPLDIFPCVWLWEEVAFTDDAPWNGQAYAIGIEPQVAYPALGMTELRARGRHGLRIGPERAWPRPLPSGWSMTDDRSCRVRSKRSGLEPATRPRRPGRRRMPAGEGVGSGQRR